MQSDTLRDAIIDVFISHYRLYKKHDACRQGWERETGKSWHQRDPKSDLYKGIVVCGYHEPFISRTVLWVESGAAMFANPVEFDRAVDELIREQIVTLVDYYPQVVSNDLMALTDFQNANVGDMYLNTPLLRRAYKYSVELAATLKEPKHVKRFGQVIQI